MVAVLMAVVCGFGCHERETAAEKDYQRARDWLELGDRGTAFVYYKKAAEQGHPGAQFGLGMCYGEGIGVKKDMKKRCLGSSRRRNRGILWHSVDWRCAMPLEKE